MPSVACPKKRQVCKTLDLQRLRSALECQATFFGVGESIEDLEVFDAETYVETLLGIEKVG